MPGAKDTKKKIQSIKNTGKITKAMEMVAASKMRKAQERMSASRPYAQRMRTVIGHMAKSHAEYQHLYLKQCESPKNVGVILVGTDRGLCGGLNANLFRMVAKQFTAWKEADCQIQVAALGQKAEHFAQRSAVDLVASARHLGDTPEITDLIGAVKVMLDKFEAGEIDVLHIASNDFINTMKQSPQILPLLPLVPVEDERFDYYWDYIYEPDAQELMETLLKRYVESQVYQSVVENIACEQAARMVAMKSASDNAAQLIEELQLLYNKARQAAITAELSEIVAGAEAV